MPYQKQSRHYSLFVLFICLCLPLPLQASWWEKTKDAVRELGDNIEQKLAKSESSPAALTTPDFDSNDAMVQAANKFQWQLRYEQEPVWQSQVAVLEAGVRGKPTVLLVHGLGENAMLDWLPVIPALTKNYHVLALDLPGFGRSTKPAGEYSPANYAKIILWLMQKFGTDKVHLVGHSLGAAVSLTVASAQPAQLQQLILVDAAGILERTAFVKSLAFAPVPLDALPRMIQSPGARAVDFAEAMIERVSVLGDPTVLLKNKTLRHTVVGQSPSTNAALALIETDYSNVLGNVVVPTAILWGGKDTVAPLRTGLMLEYKIRGANLTVIPDAEHVPMASHSAEFNQWLLDRLAGGETAATVSLDQPLKPQGELTDLTLSHCSNQHISGSYNIIRVSHCKNIVFDKVRAQRLDVSHSVVELLNVELVSESRSFTSEESVVLGTNVLIKGVKPSLVSGSRIDFAGARWEGTKAAFEVKQTSLLVFSVCETHSAGQLKNRHGSYRVKETAW